MISYGKAMSQPFFELTRWRFIPDTPSIEFSFHCSVHGDFTETLSFPYSGVSLEKLQTEELGHIITLLHCALGTSYYKLSGSKKITIRSGPVTLTGKGIVSRIYDEGMSEFRYRNNLPVSPKLDIQYINPPHQRPLADERPEHFDIAHEIRNRFDYPQVILAFGGGKDSYVARNIVKRAQYKFRSSSVATSQRVANVLTELNAGNELDIIQRTLDARLSAATAQSGLNGHVPITAINSFALIIHAVITGAEMVVFANERSADEPTIDRDGLSVNHQYSKSFEFEQLVSSDIKAITNGRLTYFSLLRPVSELWITRYLSKIDDALNNFTSCNKNFFIAAQTKKKWCCECAKCAFTFLTLAPFLPRKTLEKIFQGNPLEDPTLLDTYMEMLGLKDNKPWDCVGTTDEVKAALWRLSNEPEWKNAKIVSSLAALASADDPETRWDNQFTIENSKNVPKQFHQYFYEEL